MGAKKRALKAARRALADTERVLATLSRETASLDTQLANARTDRDRVHEHLAKAGFLRVDGLRTVEDRLHAAQMGVLVFDDVHLLSAPQYTVETPESPTFYGPAALRSIVMPAEHSLKLEITGEPAILRALAEAIKQHV